ncbi:aspartyl-phosphate phosphatase Spo0E family protein [Peribacillus sp. SCS-155]|uniref:aspartyl-phosphate phosphatase Spo0E family protein n=1 Tax=Peribacillus sedimenti TaxID=3115297 RepID=UPI0039063FF1
MTGENLLNRIEESRRKMINLASYSSMIDKQVVEASTELDKLIIKYFDLSKKQ